MRGAVVHPDLVAGDAHELLDEAVGKRELGRPGTLGVSHLRGHGSRAQRVALDNVLGHRVGDELAVCIDGHVGVGNGGGIARGHRRAGGRERHDLAVRVHGKPCRELSRRRAHAGCVGVIVPGLDHGKRAGQNRVGNGDRAVRAGDGA